MSYHVFLASENNYNTCVQKGVYGGRYSHGDSRSAHLNSEVISSFAGIKLGDLVFFYVKNKGIYGLWRVTSEAFYDTTPIWEGAENIYSVRVCFEPAIRKFSTPIAMTDILDVRDKGRIWTFDLGTMTRKSHYPITSDEGKELIRLLLRNNPIFIEPDPIPEPYSPAKRDPLHIDLQCDKNGRIKYEGYLNAWFMRSFALGQLKEVIGDYRDYLNYVPTSFNKVMDIFLTHVTTVDSVDILHKFTCMELKTGIVSEDNLNQIIRYENWIARRLGDGDSEMVQGILVGFDFNKEVLEYWRKRKAIEEKTIRLIKYRVNPSRDGITIEEIEH